MGANSKANAVDKIYEDFKDVDFKNFTFQLNGGYLNGAVANKARDVFDYEREKN